jgi:hypothetical protein
MERDNYLEGIRSAWLGEQFGEVFFNALATRTEDPSLRSTWQTLARLEKVTGKRMAALLEAHGEPVGAAEPIEIGDEVLSQYTDASLRSMEKMKDVVTNAIVRFDQLLAVAPESDVPSVRFLVDHEQALLTFVDCQIAGDQAHALEDVEALLEHGS